jgi:23S rRNA (guanosine2251-2'-O)-methyltransferase
MKTAQEIYGLRAIMEAIQQDKAIDKIWLLKGQQGQLFKHLEQKIREKGISHSYVPVERLERFSNQNHQGAVARIAPISFVSLETLIESNTDKKAIYLLLDGITDARNLGAIIRTAAAVGVSGVILPQTGSAPVNADTVKTSAGGIFSVPLVKVNHLKDAVFLFQAHQIKCVAVTEKANKTAYEEDLNESLALVVGSEDKGIQKSLLQMATTSVKLPMNELMDSLNVSVACGVLLYEIQRQQYYS